MHKLHAPKKTSPHLTASVVRADLAIRIDLRFRNSWQHMKPEDRVRILQSAASFLTGVREQMIDEVTDLLDGAAGPIDMDAEMTL